MEEEVDLRAYVQVLLRNWQWIAGLALIAASAGFVLSQMRPTVYEASSVVFVTEPRYRMQFDPRFSTSQATNPAYPAFPVIAVSDGVLQKVVDDYEPSPEAAIDSWRLSVLSRMVEARSEGDPSLVRLAVRSRSAKDATNIANAWADTLVAAVNRIYGGSESDVDFFEERAAQALQTLEVTDDALIEFEARNQTSTIEAQLESLRQAQEDYLGDQRTTAYIGQDIQGLVDQLALQPESQSISFADSLTALLLQIKAFDAQGGTTEEVPAPAPIELQINSSESISEMSRAEQVELLGDLATALQSKSTEVDARLVELQPQILILQRQLQEATIEKDHLLRAQEIASDTYLTLVRKLDEARIASQQQAGLIQVGSHASVPEQPMSRHRLSNAFAAAMLGLLVGVVVAFVIEFWRKRGQETDDEGGASHPARGVSAQVQREHDTT